MANDVAWREYDVHKHHERSAGGDLRDDDDADDEDSYRPPVDIFSSSRNEDDDFEIREYHLYSEGATCATVILREREDYDVSTGMSVWKGSEIMCRYLVEHPKIVRGRSVLELGAGAGLCGIVAARLLGETGGSVLLTDGDVVVLRNLRRNAEANGFRNVEASCPQLIWGRARAQEFREENGMQEVIMATDCVYVTRSARPLFETVATILEPDGVFLFVNSCASICPLEDVIRIGKEFGFTASPNELWHRPGDENDPVYVFRR